MKARMAADRQLFSRSINQLAAPVQAMPETGGDESCSHPVFLACQMLANRAGFKVRPHPSLMRGAPSKDPVNAIARASNVRVRRVTLKGEWWKDESGGLLCFQEETNAPLAILPSKRGLEAYDTATQSFQKLTPEMAQKINPSAYVFYRPFPAIALSARDLAQFALTGTYREFGLIVAAGVGVGVLAMLMPYATGIVFDQLIPGAERAALGQMCLFLAVASLASSLLSLARGFAVLRLQGKMDSHVQAAVWDRLLSLPVSFFRDYSSGDLAERLAGVQKAKASVSARSFRYLMKLGSISIASTRPFSPTAFARCTLK